MGAGPLPGLELYREQRPARPQWVGVGLVGCRGPYPSGHQLFFPHPSPHLWPLGQTYYGQVLKKSADLQTNACVTAARPVPQHIREALQNVHEEVSLR